MFTAVHGGVRASVHFRKPYLLVGFAALISGKWSHCFSIPRSMHTKLPSRSCGKGPAAKHNFTNNYIRKLFLSIFYICPPVPPLVLQVGSWDCSPQRAR